MFPALSPAVYSQPARELTGLTHTKEKSVRGFPQTLHKKSMLTLLAALGSELHAWLRVFLKEVSDVDRQPLQLLV